jgi:predicted amidohydrolase
VKVAVVQHDIVWEDESANFDRLVPMVAAAAGTGAKLVVLSETFSTGFTMNDDVLTTMSANGPGALFLQAVANAHDVWVCGSLPEIHEGFSRPHNTLVLAGPDGAMHRYRKIHPFGYGSEPEHFEAGDRLVTVDVDGLRVSLFVCYDLRFADEFWGLAQQTDLYVVVANWPAARRLHWKSLLQARAIENLAYVVGCNRVGAGGGLDYAGDSRIIDPLGEVLASAAGSEALIVAEVDAANVAAVRDRFRFLQDRRPISPATTVQPTRGAHT